MANRILQYIDCDCCRSRRIHERWESVAESIDSIVGTELLGISVTSANRIADGEQPALTFWVNREPAPCTDLGEAREHVASELRTMADLLTGAAAKLEGGAE